MNTPIPHSLREWFSNLPELETTLIIVQRAATKRHSTNPSNNNSSSSVATVIALRPQLLFLCTTTTHVHCLPDRRPWDAPSGHSSTRLSPTTPGGRAPHSARTCCSCCTHFQRCTCADTAWGALGGPAAPPAGRAWLCETRNEVNRQRVAREVRLHAHR